MAAKRKRRASPHGKGLPPGEIMKRDRQAGSNFVAWGWVGSDVSDVSDISREHILATCNFSSQNGFFLCGNSYRSLPTVATTKQGTNIGDAAHDGDVIVISDDDGTPECNKKACRKNPQCLNYLGQEVWENEGWCSCARPSHAAQ
jgi:ubiquitin carboxyl-terminal hydrolase 48